MLVGVSTMTLWPLDDGRGSRWSFCPGAGAQLSPVGSVRLHSPSDVRVRGVERASDPMNNHGEGEMGVTVGSSGFHDAQQHMFCSCSFWDSSLHMCFKMNIITKKLLQHRCNQNTERVRVAQAGSETEVAA